MLLALNVRNFAQSVQLKNVLNVILNIFLTIIQFVSFVKMELLLIMFASHANRIVRRALNRVQINVLHAYKELRCIIQTHAFHVKLGFSSIKTHNNVSLVTKTAYSVPLLLPHVFHVSIHIF